MDFKILLERITFRLKYISRKYVLQGFYSEEDLFQEMCLFLWQNYASGLPIGKNEAYVVKACEFHLQNFLRKGRPKRFISSLDEIIASQGLTLGEILEDEKVNFNSDIANKITINEIKNLTLTPKEKRVLSFLLEGKTVREIAKEIGISHVMVLKYKKNIIKKWKKKVTKK
ncbi:MAG: sigma-70 family RNA polymerase sigma factor [Candidatus Omnitrophota bacterium]